MTSWVDMEGAPARSLLAAVEGLELTAEERRTLVWLQRWEPETVFNVASIIRKAWAAGLAEHPG